VKRFRFFSDLEYLIVGWTRARRMTALPGGGMPRKALLAGCETPLASALLGGNTSVELDIPSSGPEMRTSVRLRGFG
jgi:hypothetical protein